MTSRDDIGEGNEPFTVTDLHFDITMPTYLRDVGEFIDGEVEGEFGSVGGKHDELEELEELRIRGKYGRIVRS